MTPRERFICALEGGTPDRVPTFELEFQLADLLMGKDFLHEEELEGLTEAEIDKALYDNARYLIEVYEKLEHDAICLHYLSCEHLCRTIKYIREIEGKRHMLLAHGDGTFSITDACGMEEFAIKMYEEPEELAAEAEELCMSSINRNHALMEAGIDGFILCSDYCFNNGPFISPEMFRVFITPYLTRIIADIREHGCYAIKHTDGDIMKILDQLVEAHPHAIHSIDPMAGVDIKKVKELTYGKVALCGNVHCAALQTGTVEDVRASAEYCLKYGKQGGGYIYCTSNVPFKGLPLERYMLVLDIWKEHRDY